MLAFAGIARPSKFWETLAAAGAEVAGRAAFPDHHPYTVAEVERVLARAAALGAEPVTTPKDAVRLPPPLRARVGVVGVRLLWEDETALDAVLREAVDDPDLARVVQLVGDGLWLGATTGAPVGDVDALTAAVHRLLAGAGARDAPDRRQ